ncbi:MAG: PLP-dependent aminotransferase family protein, partial [Pirellula sp.]
AARLIYTTPSRQYPTGATMSVTRRLDVLRAAKRLDAWLIEDDYDSEFRYSRPPLPSLHSLDENHRVLYVGSMSKVLFPSLRIGYVVLPQRLLDSFEQLRRTVDDHGPLIDQATLAEFMEVGAYYRHIRRCRKRYSERLDAFQCSVEKHRIPLIFPFTDGGMNQTGRFLDQSVDDEQISQVLAGLGLRVPSLKSCSLRQRTSGLIFGFTAFEPAAIRSAVSNMARIIGERV